MKVSLWNHTVSPPSTTTSPRLIHSIRSTFCPRSLSQATWISVATITTMVASSTGASSGPTTPPATMPPRYWVANAAAHAVLASAYLKVPKNRMIGRKSSSSFMSGASVASARAAAAAGRSSLGLEVDRCRVDAVALTGGLRPVLEHVPEVAAAVGAAHFDTRHAVAVVDQPLDAPGLDLRVPAGPAAAGVELGAAVEQHLLA